MGETTAARGRKKKTEPNMVALTPDARLALHFQHADKIADLEAAARAANGRLRTARKTAKGDLGEEGLKEIDVAIWSATPEGQAEIRAEVERMVRVSAWHGTDLGGQVSFLNALPPRDFKNEGKLSGLHGTLCKPPDGLSQADAQLWMEGWGLGQAVLIEGFGKRGAVDQGEHKAHVASETAKAEAGAGDDGRDLRAPFMRPENQQHPKDKPPAAEGSGEGEPPPAIGTAPSTIKKLH